MCLILQEQSFQEIAKEVSLQVKHNISNVVSIIEGFFCLSSQLEQKCFSQQEQLESLQEEQGEEQERSQRRISELETRVDQVGG